MYPTNALYSFGHAYTSHMPSKLYTLELVEMLPLPEIPEQYGARNEEEHRFLKFMLTNGCFLKSHTVNRH